MTETVSTATNPALGVAIFALGGLAGAIFYLPFKKVKNWAWESYWMIYAITGLVIVPWLLALGTSPNFTSVIKSAPSKEVIYCFLCGAMWGVGGLTWGLMIRYLGVGLGLAIGCGLCSAAGTIIPTMIKGQFLQLFKSTAGIVSLIGVAVSVTGIILVGKAGMSKENELPEEEKKKAVAEFNFKKGIIVAIFSGLMSSAMSF
ncbi:MAG: L-rhamnose/proton symporter RhaT, partial [Limisphaerales bacterium]